MYDLPLVIRYRRGCLTDEISVANKSIKNNHVHIFQLFLSKTT
jgi:hypothetical protein